MAIDNTPPRLRLIITIAFIVVVTLFGLNFVFESYYAFMSDDAYRSKLAPTTDRDDHKKAEQASLTAANVDKTMLSLGQGTRPEAIVAKPSDDVAPLTGWTKMPKALPPQTGWGLPPPGGAPPVPTDGPTLVDGGHAAAAGDAGATKADAGAGAPHH